MTPKPRPFALRAPAFYSVTLFKENGPSRLLVPLVEAARTRRRFQATVGKLAELFHKNPRTIKRWARVLRERGYISVRRMGRGQPNVYELQPWFERRIRGVKLVRRPAWLQEIHQRLPLNLNGRPADNRVWRR